MPKRPSDQRPRLGPPASADYDVGYGKPPAEHRFQKGQSGNPRGRPKGAKNKLPALHEERLKTIILEEAYRTIRINDGDRQVKVPMAQAIVRSLAVNAVKGQQRAQRLFTELLSATELANRRLHDEWMDVAITYKVEWERELDRRRRFNITDLPEPLPHPDHVVVDLRTGTVTVRGPATPQEKAQYDRIIASRAEFEEELVYLNGLLEDPSYTRKDIVLEEIRRTERVIEIIDSMAR